MRTSTARNFRKNLHPLQRNVKHQRGIWSVEKVCTPDVAVPAGHSSHWAKAIARCAASTSPSASDATASNLLAVADGRLVYCGKAVTLP